MISLKYRKIKTNGYNLHLINTDKFKSVMVRIYLRRPIKKDEITKRNILCNMFSQSTKKYPSKRDLTIKSQNLYAADVFVSNSRLGNYILTKVDLTVLNDKYTEEGNFEEAIKFLKEIIFNPDVNEENFNKEKLDIVKTSCKNSLTALKESASDYSLVRLLEEFSAKEPCSYRMMGYLDDLDNIDTNNLYEYYKDVIENDIVDIYVIGNINEERTIENIKDNFNFNKIRNSTVNTIVDNDLTRKEIKNCQEQIDNSQSKLSIAARINDLSDYERKYPLTLFNIIFGGGPDSKLFKNVREKNSLCYTIFSVINKLDSIMIIRSGIDKINFDKAIKLIKEDLEEMKKGNFNDNDIKIAKEYFNTALDEIEEREDQIIDNYYLIDLINNDPIDVRRQKINKVTKDEIIQVANKVNIDTIFCLEGVKND